MLQLEEPLLSDEPVVASNEDVLLDTEEQIAESLQYFQTAVKIGTNAFIPVGDDDNQMPNFSTQGCNCTLSKGASCSSQFADEYLLSVHLNCMEMTCKELDLVILGQLSACNNVSPQVATSGGHYMTQMRKRSVHTINSCIPDN